MANRYYTILIVPEKTEHVKKFMVPAWLVKGAVVTSVFAVVLGAIMLLDYSYVLGQIGENRQLKLENRKLRQQVQIFENKITTIESTLERIKTFSTRLKVITNIEDRANLVESLNKQIPDASTNIGSLAAHKTGETSDEPADAEDTQSDPDKDKDKLAEAAPDKGNDKSKTESAGTQNPENELLKKVQLELDSRFLTLHRDGLIIEQTLQDQYELLADQKAFLAALPTRKPAVGYFTSGLGVRRSPYGGRVKMHEGLDIANHPGTPIRAPADGVVIYAETKPGYGQTIILDHGYGLETWYGHSKKLLVKKGQKVHRGDQIALLGNSGRSTGPHLHYEVRIYGTPVDPLLYILEN